MRLRIAPAIALGVATATMSPAALAVAATPLRPAVASAPAPPADQQPTCGDPDSADFPIGTRLRGGPDTYHPGGGFKHWYLELANVTDESCHNIHPVIVIADRDRELASSQAKFEFYDEDVRRWRRVPFEKTDEDEHIGVFANGFRGFTVAADKTVTVQVRLTFASGTQPGDVVTNAAVVQRHGDDGEWVGESNDYRFAIDKAEADDADDVDEAEKGKEPGAADAGRDPDSTPARPDDATPRIGEHRRGSLAMTGPRDHLLPVGATAGALLLGGGALVAGSRRLRGPGATNGPRGR
ncbi:hypothetical protein J7I98_19820 [Streptomyces sp. ISL-98]|uniref:hypothetical protein n=1 Tax=Streptomyces sp. ISL-98 TaxID=2819192 RepID=UPI001BE62CC4|nr:hypothetical protein [Streptomyces sp. ISL-98]MBT2508093.1 hypothetical protein [Streptomyces sp. ISL-98]